MPNEIELKLRIAAADVLRLRRHRALKQHLVSKPITRKLTSIYYDTPDLKLLDTAISLRVRRMSGNWFQAIKGAGYSLAGLHQRMEWEDIIAKGEPDFSKITEPGLTRIFDLQSLRDALKPVFITEVNRTEWQLQYEDGSAIEVALDLGELQVGKQREDISEIELELKHGEEKHLFELALALQADIPLHIENVSKAQRGYAYYRTSPLTTTKSQPIALSAKTKVVEAFQQIAWECLRQLQGNHDMALHGDESEGVHQMHIGLRRLRVALKLFKHQSDELETELGWLSELLGNARDWDVLLRKTLPAANVSSYEIETLAEKAQKRAYISLRTALSSQRYQRLLLSLGAWLESDYQSPHKTLSSFAHKKLRKVFEKLCQHKNLSGLSPEQRHKVRIAVKNMRYSTDFFAALCKNKKLMRKQQDFLGKLSHLQKLMGVMNDIATTEKLLAQLTGKQSTANILEAVEVLAKWNATRLAEADKTLTSSWHALLQAAPY